MRSIVSERARLARAAQTFAEEATHTPCTTRQFLDGPAPRIPAKLPKRIDPRLHRGIEQIRRVTYDEGDEPMYGFGDDG